MGLNLGSGSQRILACLFYKAAVKMLAGDSSMPRLRQEDHRGLKPPPPPPKEDPTVKPIFN